MLNSLKQHWHRFKETRPGERFKAHFWKRQKQPNSTYKKALVITTGILIMITGVILLPAPGPGILILLIGAALIAQESLTAARFMDWADIRARKVCAWGLRTWRHVVRRSKS